MRCVIIDDEYLSIYLIKKYVERHSELNLIACFTNAIEAINFLEVENIDLILTDIQMPMLSGIDIVKILQTKHPSNTLPLIIFTTANPQYAVQAFDLEVIDFLVKPIPYDRFSKAIGRAILRYNEKIKVVQDTILYINVKSNYQNTRILLKNILWIEVRSEYVYINTATEVISTIDRLKNIQLLLPEINFIRIHKSFLVAISAIQSYNATTITLNNSVTLPIGRQYKQNITKYFKKI